MDNATFEQLLHEEEGNTLDFKQQQYLFVQAEKSQRAELLKDILGFANAAREKDAFILIGVKEVRGERSEVVGIEPSQQLQDHDLQQFVSSVTNTTIRFRYEAFRYENKDVGVICIERQPRPFWLTKDYGYLKANAVYVRRGSSIDIQKPATIDEAIRMATEDKALASQPVLTVEAGLSDSQEPRRSVVSWSAVLCEMPAAEDLPDYGRTQSRVRLPNGEFFPIPDYAALGIGSGCNPDFLRELADYMRFHHVARQVSVTITNVGPVAAENVRTELAVFKGGDIEVTELGSEPNVPKPRRSIYDTPGLRSFRAMRGTSRPGDVHVERVNEESKITIEFGDIQPGRTATSQPFYASALQTGVHVISGKVFAANLREPLDIALSFSVSVERKAVSVSDLEVFAEKLIAIKSP